MRAKHRVSIKNFGRNVVYQPKYVYEPKTEAEVLDILEKHKHGHIRVQSTGHSWSDIVAATDVLVRLIHFKKIVVEERKEGPVAKTGSGAVLQDILDTLHASSTYTLPTMGGIKLQTIGGATATATHGTGNTSLSNFIQAVKIACYNSHGKPRIATIAGGDELLAARASLGCMGIILEMTIEIVPRFWMRETLKQHKDPVSILNGEPDWPQQQFFVFPHGWRWYAYHRKVVGTPAEPGKTAIRLFKLYDYVLVEMALHALVKFAQTSAIFFGKGAMIGFWKYVVPVFMRPHALTGDNETILTLHTEHHDTFRHVEMELFVPKKHVQEAMAFTQEVLSYLAGTRSDVSPRTTRKLEQAGLLDDSKNLGGTYVHNYPLFFRHILPEETLVAMNQGAEWYSMSIFSFNPPHANQPYYDACTFLARALARMYAARPHWGKYNPLSHVDLEPLYPNLNRFRDICKRYDPNGVFQNDYTRRVLGPAPGRPRVRDGNGS